MTPIDHRGTGSLKYLVVDVGKYLLYQIGDKKNNLKVKGYVNFCAKYFKLSNSLFALDQKPG